MTTQTDRAHDGQGKPTLACRREGCDRAFFTEELLTEHAEAVHTFNDIERIVSEAVREKYGKKRTANDKNYIYVWLNDIASDWAIFSVEGNASSTTYKIPYTMSEDNLSVTLGEPYEVKRRTVWDKVEGSTKKGEA